MLIFFLFFFSRLQLAALHFNENASRQQATNQQGDAIYSVSFPKGRKGEGVAKEVKVKQTFSKYSFVCCMVLNKVWMTSVQKKLTTCSYHGFEISIYWHSIDDFYVEKNISVLLNKPVVPFFFLIKVWILFLLFDYVCPTFQFKPCI